MPGRNNKKVSCDLCCDTIERGQDVLKCEGDCGCTVHRYCAGVTKGHFERLNKGPSPFVCQWCSLKTTNAVIHQLQAELAATKLELTNTKSLLEQHQRESVSSAASYAAAAAQARGADKKHTRSRPQRTLPQRSRQQSATINAAGPRRAPATTPSTDQRDGTPLSTSTSTSSQQPRIKVEGARRIWGTLKNTTTKSIENAISRLCKIDGLNIKRKLRRNHSGKSSWWFIIHAPESVLCDLDNKWDGVNVQTSWSLMSCSKPADSTSTNVEPPTNQETPNNVTTQLPSVSDQNTDQETSNPSTATTLTLVDPVTLSDNLNHAIHPIGSPTSSK